MWLQGGSGESGPGCGGLEAGGGYIIQGLRVLLISRLQSPSTVILEPRKIYVDSKKKKEGTNELIYKRETDSQTENKFMVPKGEVGGGIN